MILTLHAVALAPAAVVCQVLGGNGYVNDYPTGRILRDAKLYEIGAGGWAERSGRAQLFSACPN